MISEHVVDLTSSISKTLTQSKKKVYPVDNSPLYELVQANIGASYYLSNKMSLESMVTDSLGSGAGGGSIHSDKQTEIVEHVSSVINGNFSLVKSKVTPMRVTLNGYFDDELANTPTRVGLPVEIRPNAYHRLWGHSTLQSMFSTYSKSPLVPVVQNIKFPELLGDELNALVKSRISSIDTAIEDWIQDQAPDKVINVYNRFFRLMNGNVTVGKTIKMNHLSDDDFDRNDYLIAYLIANSFVNETPDGIPSSISLAALENHLFKLRDALGKVVYGVIANREVVCSTKHLVFSYVKDVNEYTSKTKHVLNVNQDVLLEFYNNGGSAEILFGAAVSNFGFDVDKMLANADTLRNKWSSALNTHASEVGAIMLTVKRKALTAAFIRFVKELEPEELPAPLAEVLNRGKHLIGSLRQKDFESVEHMLQLFICDVLFTDTNAKLIIKTMEDTHLDVPDLTARECALFAKIDILALWLANQMKVSNVK